NSFLIKFRKPSARTFVLLSIPLIDCCPLGHRSRSPIVSKVYFYRENQFRRAISIEIFYYSVKLGDVAAQGLEPYLLACNYFEDRRAAKKSVMCYNIRYEQLVHSVLVYIEPTEISNLVRHQPLFGNISPGFVKQPRNCSLVNFSLRH